MVEIIPTVLSLDPRAVQEKIVVCEGVVKKVQIDIVDGVFAANKTLDPSFYETIETILDLDFHLMTKEPADWVERAFRGGADRIIGQIEMMQSQIDFLGKVQELGSQVGLAVDLKTSITEITSEALSSVDVVLLMSVPAGFGGQEFDPKVLGKIKELSEIRQKKGISFKICVDGGINEDNIKEVVEAGADEVAVGKLFEGGLVQNLEKLMKAANG